MLKFHLGVALAKTGETQAALPYLQQSVGEAAAHYNLGVIIYESMLQQSARYFARTLTIDPKFTIARHWLDEVREELRVVSIFNAPRDAVAWDQLPEIQPRWATTEIPEPASQPTNRAARPLRPGIQLGRWQAVETDKKRFQRW